MSIYFNNPWKPVPQTIIKSTATQQKVEGVGYSIENKLSQEKIDKLTAVYDKYHDIKAENGGMFYSIYSQDLEYRNNVSREIANILGTFLDENLKDYKTMLFSFVVKLPGGNSEFFLHQDTTGLDEHKHSALNIWIPLDDVEDANGCLSIVEKSHKWFSPYRSISFPAPYDNIQPTIKKYLTPLEMNKGEVLFFDNRLLHNSNINYSNQPRIAVVCGLFPQEAEMITCFKEEYKLEGDMELIKNSDNFLNEGINFFIDCQKRPKTGETIATINDPYPEISQDDFEKLCKIHNVSIKNTQVEQQKLTCDLFGEPVEKKGLFIDEKLNSKLREFGVVKIPFLNEKEVDELVSFEAEIHSERGLEPTYDDVHMTSWCSDFDYKMQVKNKINTCFANSIAKNFKNVKAVNEVFVTKLPSEKAIFRLHKDWSIVDEENYESANIWVALEDIDEHNGGIFFIHKSHLVKDLRGAGDLQVNYTDYEDKLKDSYAHYALKKGEALVFYHNTLYGSTPNLSNSNRVVAVSSIVNTDVDMQVYFKDADSDNVELIKVEDTFVYQYDKLREECLVKRPHGKLFKEVPFESFKNTSLNELENILNKK